MYHRGQPFTSPTTGRALCEPYGLLNIADLPRAGTKRWVVRRKAEVVAAVRRGLLSLEQACSRYALSAEEYLSWQNSTPPLRFMIANG
jgi:Protein of unknown function (DUF1153)